jgi:hypothetical protein
VVTCRCVCQDVLLQALLPSHFTYRAHLLAIVCIASFLPANRLLRPARQLDCVLVQTSAETGVLAARFYTEWPRVAPGVLRFASVFDSHVLPFAALSCTSVAGMRALYRAASKWGLSFRYSALALSLLACASLLKCFFSVALLVSGMRPLY